MDRRHPRRLVDACVRAHPALPFRIWSERRPFDVEVAACTSRRRLAAGLQARGLGPGDVVAFQLPNWAEAAATFFALSMLGAVLVPVVHSYGAREVGFILRQSRARALVTADRFGRLDYAATLAALRPSLPDLELVVMLAAERRRAPPEAIVPSRTVASALRSTAPIAGRSRRPGSHRLHVGHDRGAQGRDPHAPEPRWPRSASWPPSSPPATARRSSARPSPTPSACWAACCCRSTAAAPST